MSCDIRAMGLLQLGVKEWSYAEWLGVREGAELRRGVERGEASVSEERGEYEEDRKVIGV